MNIDSDHAENRDAAANDKNAGGESPKTLTFAEALDIVAGSAWRHEGSDAYSQGLDKGARDQIEATRKAFEARSLDATPPRCGSEHDRKGIPDIVRSL